MYAGLFRAPVFQFPGKKVLPSQGDLLLFPGILQSEDLLATNLVAKGTKYHTGQIVVTKVVSKDVLEVGEIQKIVVRQNSVFFLLSLYSAARNRFRYFESLPKNQVALVAYTKLADYKPLVKRSSNLCFSFLLHHHLPSVP
jgi:hypothetical protein